MELTKRCGWWCKRWLVNGEWTHTPPTDCGEISHGICPTCMMLFLAVNDSSQPALPRPQWSRIICHRCPSAVIDRSEGVVDCRDDTCCPQK